MLVIRLTRVGKKNSPAYRVVVADKRRAVKRKFIEILGHYNPTLKPKELKIDKDRALFWMKNGAQPSDTVHNLMCDLGVLDKKDKTNKIYGRKLSKKAEKEGPKEAEKKPEVKASETEESSPVAEPEDNTIVGPTDQENNIEDIIEKSEPTPEIAEEEIVKESEAEPEIVKETEETVETEEKAEVKEKIKSKKVKSE